MIPPYGVTNCKWDKYIDFVKLWECYTRIIKADGVIAIFGYEPFATYLRLSNIKNYKYDWYWEKEKGMGVGFSKKQPLRKLENIVIFYKKQPQYDWRGEYAPYKRPCAIQGNKSYSGCINKEKKLYNIHIKLNIIYCILSVITNVIKVELCIQLKNL